MFFATPRVGSWYSLITVPRYCSVSSAENPAGHGAQRGAVQPDSRTTLMGTRRLRRERRPLSGLACHAYRGGARRMARAECAGHAAVGRMPEFQRVGEFVDEGGGVKHPAPH